MFFCSFPCCRHLTRISWPKYPFGDNTRSTRAIQTTAAQRLSVYSHHLGVPSTTTPIARLAQLCNNQPQGSTPCLNSSLTNSTASVLRACTAQHIILLPTLLRGVLRPMSRSKQVPSKLRCTQTSSSWWESMLCFPTEYWRLDGFHNELVEAESHRKGYKFGSS